MTGNGYDATRDPRTGRPPLPGQAGKLEKPSDAQVGAGGDNEAGADGLVHPDDGSPPRPPRMKSPTPDSQSR